MSDHLKAISKSKVGKCVAKFITGGEHALFVLGFAGTGKSQLLKFAEASSVGRCVKLAPTGIAAHHIGGVTFNSFCRVPPWSGFSNFDANRVNADIFGPTPISLALIDEISMVSVEALEYLNELLKVLNKRPDDIFGGAKVIMFGDEHQLLPVNSDAAYFSRIFDKEPCKILRMKVNYRQKDKKFAKALRIIARGKIRYREQVISFLNMRCLNKSFLDPEVITICATNEMVKRHNQVCYKSVVAKTGKIYPPVSTGKSQKGTSTPESLSLGPEARVIATRNDPKRRFFNGSLGTVKCCNDDHILVLFDGSANPVEVRRVSTQNYKQFPLSLGFAITIHKAQGQTYDAVAVDVGRGTFTQGQLYVALSRVKTIEGLHLITELKLKHVSANTEGVKRLRQIGKHYRKASL